MPKPSGRPPRLNLDLIVERARAIAIDEGIEHLSMRRLARDLGSTPTALYHYVGDKNDLLRHVIRAQTDLLPKPELPADPRQRLIAVCNASNYTFRLYPWAAQVLSDLGATGESVNWMVEQGSNALRECGLSDEQTRLARKTLWLFCASYALFAPSGDPRNQLVEPHQDFTAALNQILDGIVRPARAKQTT